MNSYLYTWNPSRWNWADLAEAVYLVNNGHEYDTYWSCGVTRRIKIGDVFFLMRLGVEPKGIVACGYVSSEVYDREHWDEERAAKGETTPRTDLLFKALSDTPLIPLQELQDKFPSYRWTPQGGGISMPDDIAYELFTQIIADDRFSFTPFSEEEIKTYTEGKPKKATIYTYDRSSIARQKCIEHYGYNCCVCGFSFGKTYGNIGEKYIEVHHLKPIAEVGKEYEIDPIKDLRPVCANCHRMLHIKGGALSIEELRSL